MQKVKKRTKKRNARRVTVAPRRRRRVTAVNPRRHRRQNARRTRRRNPTRIVVVAPRRQNRSRRHRNGSRRNPTLFGQSLGSKGSLKLLTGGLVGVAAAKFIPTLIPTSITGTLGSTTLGRVALTGISALAAWWLASKADVSFGEGVLFGGLMQTASVALNAFLPNFTIAGVPISLGDLVEGRFAVPQNPLRGLPGGSAPSHQMAPAGSRVTASGLGRAYPAAY